MGVCHSDGDIKTKTPKLHIDALHMKSYNHTRTKNSPATPYKRAGSPSRSKSRTCKGSANILNKTMRMSAATAATGLTVSSSNYNASQSRRLFGEAAPAIFRRSPIVLGKRKTTFESLSSAGKPRTPSRSFANIPSKLPSDFSLPPPATRGPIPTLLDRRSTLLERQSEILCLSSASQTCALRIRDI